MIDVVPERTCRFGVADHIDGDIESLEYPAALIASDGSRRGRFAMMLDDKKVLAALIGLSVMVGGYQAVMFGLGRSAGAPFHTMWSLVLLVLLVLWIDLGCRERKDIYRPFEFGFLVFVFWLPYLPYSLLRTRRAQGTF